MFKKKTTYVNLWYMKIHVYVHGPTWSSLEMYTARKGTSVVVGCTPLPEPSIPPRHKFSRWSRYDWAIKNTLHSDCWICWDLYYPSLGSDDNPVGETQKKQRKKNDIRRWDLGFLIAHLFFVSSGPNQPCKSIVDIERFVLGDPSTQLRGYVQLISPVLLMAILDTLLANMFGLGIIVFMIIPFLPSRDMGHGQVINFWGVCVLSFSKPQLKFSL